MNSTNMKAYPLNKLPLTLVLFLLALVLVSCDKESEKEDFELDLKKHYAGLSIDQKKVFQVDSVLFKLGVGGLEKDSLSYIFTEIIRDTFRTPDKTLHYSIDREIQSLGEGDMLAPVSYSMSILNNTLRHNEDNKSIISLVFPPVLNIRWDGLTLFDADDYTVEILSEPIRKYKDWTDFRIIETEGTFELMGTTINRVITVLQVDAENAIERRYALEKYAPIIGLVYREEMILDTQNISNEPWEEKAERGYISRQYLIGI